MNATVLIEHQHLKAETCSEDYPDDIRLSQVDFSGNEAVIQIHKSQLLQIVAVMGLTNPSETLLKPLGNTVGAISGGDSMQQLEVEVDDDGAIHLLQTKLQGMGGSDEEIELHPMQAAWLVTKLQSLLGRTQSSEEDKLVRRLIVLREKIAEFATGSEWDEVVKRCVYGLNLCDDLNHIVELADEFLIESGAEQAIEGRTGSVTPVTPSSTVTDAVTPRSSNAERQKRYRARQKELALSQVEGGAGHE